MVLIIDIAKNNINIFDGTDVPRIKERDVNGVCNIEYDVDLENTQHISKGKLVDWITARER